MLYDKRHSNYSFVHLKSEFLFQLYANLNVLQPMANVWHQTNVSAKVPNTREEHVPYVHHSDSIISNWSEIESTFIGQFNV